MKRIAVDFDGVIMRRDGSHMPIKGAREGLNKLKRQGYDIAIHSTRALSNQGQEWIRAWMRRNAMPFDDITSRKVEADVYLDDKAQRFTDWTRVPYKPTVWDAYNAAKAELNHSSEE